MLRRLAKEYTISKGNGNLMVHGLKVEVLDKRRERLRVTPESEEDLWTIKTIVRPGDLVRGKTYRDVAVGGRGEKERKPIIVTLRVKNVEFQPFTGKLRFFGVIVEGPEEYGVKGKHQSILVTPGATIVLGRPGGWPDKVLERLRSSGPRGKAVIAAIDYDEYGLAVVSPQGVKVVVDKYVRLPGKDDPSRDQELEKLKTTVARDVVELASSYKARVVIIVGPGTLKKEIAEKVKEQAPTLKVVVDDASMGGRAGIEEALRRHTVASALQDYVVAEAETVLGELLRNAAKSPELVATGPQDVLAVTRLGAVEKLVVLDNMLFHIDDDIREAVNKAVEEAEKRGAIIIIVPEDSPPGEKIRAMGGVVAILRYPVPYEARKAILRESRSP